MKKYTKSEFACNITLLSVIACSCVHILFVTLRLFGSINFKIPANFNFIVAYVLSIVCLALYFFGFAISKFKRIMFPAWLRIFFYIAFFLFTNTYYILGLYQQIWGLVILYAYIAFLISILSVSIFYNTQKDEKNRLKSTNRFIALSVFCYSITFSTLVQVFISAIKVIFFPKYALATLTVYLIEIGTMIVVSAMLAIAYKISLEKTKKFINACLVKYVVRVKAQKSIKDPQPN